MSIQKTWLIVPVPSTSHGDFGGTLRYLFQNGCRKWSAVKQVLDHLSIGIAQLRQGLQQTPCNEETSGATLWL